MKILVVDDEAVSRQAVLQVAAEVSGEAVIEAVDGRAAWDLLQGGAQVGLVISDVRMPRMDGLELVARLRADPRFGQLPVMLATAANDRETVHGAMRAGIQGFIVKPVGAEAVGRVRHVIEQFREGLLERPAEVMTRLRVDALRYENYVAALLTGGAALAARIEAGMRTGQEQVLHELSLAVAGQRKAAAALGAQRLVLALDVLEKCLQGYTMTARSLLPQALAGYRLNLYWLLERRAAAVA